MQKMVQQRLVTNFNVDGDCEIPECLCAICQLGKFHKLPFIKDPKTPVSRIGELICADSWGPVKEKSLGGASYFISFKDDFSGFLHIFFMKKKSEGPAHLRLYHNILLNQTGKLDPQSKQGVFIGICETQKAYRIFLPETQKVIVNRHVRFNENFFYKDMILAPAQKVKF